METESAWAIRLKRTFWGLCFLALGSIVTSIGLAQIANLPRNITLIVFLFGAFAFLCSPLVAFAYYSLFRVQATLLEFMLSITVCGSFFSILTTNIFKEQLISLGEKTMLSVGAYLATLVLLGGSIWGLSAAKRLGETRTWRRLGLILLGWNMMPGAVFCLISLIVFFGALAEPAVKWGLISFGLPAGAASIWSFKIERESQRKGGEERF